MKSLFIIACLVLSFNSVCYAKNAPSAPPASDYELYLKRGHHSDAWNDLIQPGFQAFGGKNYPTAYVFMQKAYDRGCRDGLVLYKLGFIFEMRGNFAKATEFLALAAPALKKSYPTLEITKSIDEHLGRIYYQTDQYDKALPFLNSALEGDPQNFMLLFITGQIYRGKKNLAEAYARYKRALALPPPADIKPNPRLVLLKDLLVVSYEMGRRDEALGYANQILAINPRDQLALSYKRQIERRRMQQQEDKGIQKIIDQYK